MMLKRLLFIVQLSLMSAGCFAQSAPLSSVRLKKQKDMAAWNVPGANYSGITRIGGDRYAVVSDKEKGEGFYIFQIALDSIKGKVKEIRQLSAPVAVDGRQADSQMDAEGVAFVPSRQTVFVADEGHQHVVEYGLDGRRTGRELEVPRYLSADSIYPNYGFEALTYSAKDGRLWTITEHTLKKDGKRSDETNRVGCKLRLHAFSVESCKPLASFLYKTDAPTVKKKGRNYSFGVSAIAALEDGTMLLMEREFYVSKKYLGSWVRIKIYRIDLKKKNPDGYLQKELVVDFKNRLNAIRRNIANYEGMCLGPKWGDGRQSVILLSDSQNNFGNKYFHLKDYIRILHISVGKN